MGLHLQHVVQAGILLQQAHIVVVEGGQVHQQGLSGAVFDGKSGRREIEGVGVGLVDSALDTRAWRIYNGKVHSFEVVWAIMAAFGHTTTAATITSSLSLLRVAAALVAVIIFVNGWGSRAESLILFT